MDKYIHKKKGNDTNLLTDVGRVNGMAIKCYTFLAV
jgi:hypothetical protein